MATITLPNAGELALNIESELHKLPTHAAHNHFHQLAENADKIQEQAKAVGTKTLSSTQSMMYIGIPFLTMWVQKFAKKLVNKISTLSNIHLIAWL